MHPSLGAATSPRTLQARRTTLARVIARASLLGLAVALALGACRREEAPAPITPPHDSVLLPIADRGWAPGAPNEGWCGEASVQMVALHSGAWLPQPYVNAIGRSTHVDLWEDDVPVALAKAGLVFHRYPGPRGDGRGSIADFVGWVVAQVRAGHPVIVGAKLFPTEHPDWDVDHLMPVVGFTPTHLVFNSNMDEGQVRVAYAALAGRDGVSFASPTNRRFGFAVTGRAHPAEHPVRLTDASDGGTALLAHVAGLPAGAWRLVAEGPDAGEAWDFATDGGEALVPVKVPADAPRVFSVLPAP